MTASDLIDVVLALLQADATLAGLLGGSGRVRFGSLPQHEQIPGVYVTGGGASDRSSTMPGYLTTGHRECDDLVRCDVFASTPETARDILQRLDPVLFLGAQGAGIVGFARPSGMKPVPDPDRPDTYHAAATYAAQYRVSDI